MKRYPSPPVHIGRRNAKHKDLDNKRNPFTIVDEIREKQNKGKIVYLQKLRFDDNRIEYRIAYWIIGKKKKIAGKWVYGQCATMAPKKILERIIKKAIAKGWIAI